MKISWTAPLLLWACTPVATGADAGPTADYTFEALEGTFPIDGVWGFAVADKGDGTSILFGGTTHDDFGGEVQNGTFLVDARQNPPTITDLAPAGAPPPRYCGCAAYDSTRDVMLHVAGRDLGQGFTETLALRMDPARWETVPSAAHPDIGIACALTYSASEDAYYLYGGGGPADLINETWRIAASLDEDWQLLITTGSPTPRYDSALRAIDGGARLLLIAGADPFNGDYYGDVWSFDVANKTWDEVITNGPTPPGRRVPWLRLSPDEKTLLMGFGSFGNERGDVRADLWKLDVATSTWSEVEVGNMPAGRGFSKLVPAAPPYIGYLLSGYDGGEVRDDLFVLRGAF